MKLKEYSTDYETYRHVADYYTMFSMIMTENIDELLDKWELMHEFLNFILAVEG